jgi:hypothetical protein
MVESRTSSFFTAGEDAEIGLKAAKDIEKTKPRTPLRNRFFIARKPTLPLARAR